MLTEAITSSIVNLGKPIDVIFPRLSNYETLYEGGFTWHIDNWSSLEDSVKKTKVKRISSPLVDKISSIDKFSWRLFVYPSGNNDENSIAIYLSPQPLDKENEDWSVCVHFAIFFSRPGQDEVNIGKVSYYRFSKDETDWGFADMMNISKFKTKYANLKDTVPTGLLEDENKINITCYLRVIKDETGVTWHNFKNYDSKKYTNYIGFENQGATCYLNSLLQTYFMLQKFRDMVYKIDTSGKTDPTNHVELALQRLFYNLQTSRTAVNTVELTKSFGWDSGDSFVQNDIQEFNRLLLDKLEDSMDLKFLFVGEMKSYIRCINVKYESSKIEEFWDIQLNVKNMSSIQESFDHYIEEEILEGENSYYTDKFGFQKARKGVIFKKFPSILFIQLNRFEYDFNLDKLLKINDNFVFTDTLDLSEYVEKSIGDEIYKLHGVLVHSGDLDTGHYYAILKPKDTWMTFDDDKVWKVREEEVFQDNFGCSKKSDEILKRMTKQNLQRYLIKRQTSAYMLVYIKQNKSDEILKDVSQEQIPSNVVEKILKEQEAEHKYQEQLNVMSAKYKLKIIDSNSLSEHRGFDLFPNDSSKFFNPEFDKTFKPLMIDVDRSISIHELKELEFFKGKNIWSMGYTKSQSLRINKCMTFGVLKDYLHNALDSFIFVEDILDLKVSLDKQFLVFVKTFGFEKDQNQIIPMKVTPFTKLFEICENLTQRGIATDSVCIEEIGPNDLVKLNVNKSLLEHEISNGDILAFGANAIQTYKDIRFRLKLRFKPLIEDKDHKTFINTETMREISHNLFLKDFDTISIWTNGNCSYKEVAENLAKKLNLDYKYLRICANYENKKVFMSSKSLLKDYLITNYSFDTIPEFNFQILKTPLTEFENMKTLKVKWFSDSYTNSQLFEIKLFKSSSIKDLRMNLIKKLELLKYHKDCSKTSLIGKEIIKMNEEDILNHKSSNSGAESLSVTLWTNDKNHRFTGILTDDISIDEIAIAETICARNLQLNDDCKNIIVMQCCNSLNNTHGTSFIFQLVPNENFIDTLDRLNDTFGLGKKEFSKIKFSSFSHKTNTTIYISNKSNKDLSTMLPYEIYDSSDIFFMDHPNRNKNVLVNRQMSIR
ncbi:hypothetical protein QEN19_002557 [Hanseniaspora menglaensis]